MVTTADLERLFGPVGAPASTAGLQLDHALDSLLKVNADAAERITQFAGFGPGWLEEDSVPITPEAMETTACLLLVADRLCGDSVQKPFVAPSPDGGIAVEWESESGVELDLIIPPEGRGIRYLLDIPRPSGGFHEDEGLMPRDASLSDLLSHLL